MPINIISRTHSVTADTGDLEDVRRELERGARLERQGLRMIVSFSITFSAARVYGREEEEVTVSLYRDRGQRPSLVLQQAEESGSLHQALRYLVGRRQDVEELGEITAVQMTLTEAK
jgi:hypothetical protein